MLKLFSQEDVGAEQVVPNASRFATCVCCIVWWLPNSGSRDATKICTSRLILHFSTINCIPNFEQCVSCHSEHVLQDGLGDLLYKSLSRIELSVSHMRLVLANERSG